MKWAFSLAAFFLSIAGTQMSTASIVVSFDQGTEIDGELDSIITISGTIRIENETIDPGDSFQRLFVDIQTIHSGIQFLGISDTTPSVMFLGGGSAEISDPLTSGPWAGRLARVISSLSSHVDDVVSIDWSFTSTYRVLGTLGTSPAALKLRTSGDLGARQQVLFVNFVTDGPPLRSE